MSPEAVAERVARESYGRLLALLAARTRDVAAAEDALAEAFAAALSAWPRGAVPDNPEAWLFAAAKRKLIDAARREKTAHERERQIVLGIEELEAEMTATDTPDRRLGLMFACAHPTIDGSARTALMLQVVLGFSAERIASADGAKASLFATIGPQGVGGVALSGHTDVVPVAGQAWSSDPFRLVARDGRLYGRGTADMKGFLACTLAAVPDLVRRRLATPIHIAFSYDEEIGCVGVRGMIGKLGAGLVRPRMVIVGEPTRMSVVDAHKGPARWRITVKGRAAHSSMAPLGVNAVSYAGRLISELARIEAELKQTTHDARFDPPYATLQITEIEGGTASNIVPVACRIGFEVRALPGLDVAEIERRIVDFAQRECLPEMRAVAEEAAIDIQRSNEVPPFSAAGSEVVALALKLAGMNETHAVSYATEAGLYQDAGAPAVVIGPGDIAQAHTADEWIAISELARCQAFLGRLADWAEG